MVESGLDKRSGIGQLKCLGPYKVNAAHFEVVNVIRVMFLKI